MPVDLSQAASNAEPPKSVPVGEVAANVASSGAAKGSEAVLPAAVPALASAGVSAPATISAMEVDGAPVAPVSVGVSVTTTISAMEVDSSTVQPAVELVTNSSVTESVQNPGVANSTVIASAQNPGVTDTGVLITETKQGMAVSEGVESVLAKEMVHEPAKPSRTEAPSLHAPPETYNSELESIVVLDRSDLEGISKS